MVRFLASHLSSCQYLLPRPHTSIPHRSSHPSQRRQWVLRFYREAQEPQSRTGASSWSCERASCRAAAECPGTNMPQSQSQPASHHAVHKRLHQRSFGSQEWLSLESVAGVWCCRSGTALWQGFCSVQTQQERSQLCHQLLPASTSQNCSWGAWGGVGTAPCTFPSCTPCQGQKLHHAQMGLPTEHCAFCDGRGQCPAPEEGREAQGLNEAGNWGPGHLLSLPEE